MGWGSRGKDHEGRRRPWGAPWSLDHARDRNADGKGAGAVVLRHPVARRRWQRKNVKCDGT